MWTVLVQRSSYYCDIVLQKSVQANEELVLSRVQEAIDILRGAVTIVYPMGLPPYDPIRLEFENNEDLSGTQVLHQTIVWTLFRQLLKCFWNVLPLWNTHFSLWFKTPLFNNSQHFKSGYHRRYTCIFNTNTPLFWDSFNFRIWTILFFWLNRWS